MRFQYFFILLPLLLFFSCEEEVEEFGFEDIPHEFTKVGFQNGPPGLGLQLFGDNSYELIFTSTGCLITIIDGKKIGPSFSTCTEGEYKIENNYLELIPNPSDSLKFDHKNKYHISKYYRILDFDTICYLVDSQDKEGNFDEDIWALSVVSKLSVSKEGGLNCLEYDKNKNPENRYYRHIELPFHKKLPPQYQAYVQDTIELNLISINDSLITERPYGRKFMTYITLTFDKGEKDGILKGLLLHSTIDPTINRRESVSRNAIVSKVYPNKCEARILVKSVKEEEWIKNNVKQYSNKSWAILKNNKKWAQN